MLPAWVNEPAPTERFAQYEGEDQRERRGRGHREERDWKRKRRTPNVQRPTSKSDKDKRGHDRPSRDPFRGREHERGGDRRSKDRHRGSANRQSGSDRPLPPIAVKFFPRVAAFQYVVSQIKSGSVSYSLFALARLFLGNESRHDVKLNVPARSALFQLGRNGAA